MTIDRTKDTLMIITLLREFAALNDAGNYEAVAALFVDDGVFIRPSNPSRRITGRDNILESFRNRQHEGGRRHLVANPDIEFLSADTATVRCDSILITAHGEGGGTLSVGSFRDKLVREDDQWKFVVREGATQVAPVPYPATDSL